MQRPKLRLGISAYDICELRQTRRLLDLSDPINRLLQDIDYRRDRTPSRHNNAKREEEQTPRHASVADIFMTITETVHKAMG